MNPNAASPSFFIGWDVGGWNCDKNGKSRDAIVILDATMTIVGQPWRGNLRECIVTETTTRDWLQELFMKCGAKIPDGTVQVTMAIDTPLGFSDEFVGLITRSICLEPADSSGMNRYLFRTTERHLFELGLKPLSPVKDMIGSQATKGIHFVAKFAPRVASCGVWTDGRGFCAIETYPSACRQAPVLQAFLTGRPPLGHDDETDAQTCAVIAYLFATDRNMLEHPGENVSYHEGWIWIPKQGEVRVNGESINGKTVR